VCKGTNSRSSSYGDSKKQFDSLKQRYTNCTLVDGNLELTGMNDLTAIDFTKVSCYFCTIQFSFNVTE